MGDVSDCSPLFYCCCWCSIGCSVSLLHRCSPAATDHSTTGSIWPPCERCLNNAPLPDLLLLICRCTPRSGLWHMLYWSLRCACCGPRGSSCRATWAPRTSAMPRHCSHCQKPFPWCQRSQALDGVGRRTSSLACDPVRCRHASLPLCQAWGRVV